ncbi:MAG: hypothetical protein IMW89_15355 [Ktedonobacteraceae bacterium]|nr:hypothetical protein [Ktedonobacteraceae bacterium]
MDFHDDVHENNEEVEIGSDELLSDDQLRLPESAKPLVRIHAVRAWLARRQRETTIEIGEAALALQEIQQIQEQDLARLRRREQQLLLERTQRAQQEFQAAQQRLEAYQEAAELLQENLSHTTSSERALVEYYLTLEDLIQQLAGEAEGDSAPRYQALADVQRRIERISAPEQE